MITSKFILSLSNYILIYELEYSCHVIILIYELVYSLCVMRVSSLTLCLIKHRTYIMKIGSKLRWWFIVPQGVPNYFAYRSVGLESWEKSCSLCIRKHGVIPHVLAAITCATKSISNNLVKFTCQILSYSKLLICLAKEKRMCLQ